MDRKNFLKYSFLSAAGALMAPGLIKAETIGKYEIDKKFTHPGILHTKEDIKRIKDFVRNKKHPPVDSYKLLSPLETASANYKLQGPFPYIARDGVHAYTKAPVENDVNAAYRNALMWIITGEEKHAEKAIEIINAYAYKLKYVTGWNDNALTASLDGFMLVNAAELMRYTYGRWKKKDINRTEKMFREVFCNSLLDSFFNRPTYTNGNWGNAAIKAMMGFGVFLEDHSIFEQAVKLYYSKDKDNGSIYNYIINNTGQCQESGRDQQHVQLGLGNLAAACQVGFNQGLDMYGAYDNRLLKGYEYTAKYNLGHQVPYIQWSDVTGKYDNWEVISAEGRGNFRPIFEIAYNHYVIRKQLKMPWTEKVIHKIRPEGKPPWADCVGFGSLLFYLEKNK